LNRVALTFDDGPGAWTESILDLLAAHDARATFFVIGGFVKEHVGLVTRMVADGHEVGNHTWSHRRLADTRSSRVISRELRRTNELLGKILGAEPERFRAPEYNVDERVVALASVLGLRHTPGDVTPPDWDPRCNAAFIAAFVLARVQPSSVIGLHDGVPPHMQGRGATRQPTVDALAEILPRLAARGLECVTASQLIDGHP
jgi:peptidoglycan/xylan/chitin deacetylase (PgdA/CDA1 family)